MEIGSIVPLVQWDSGFKSQDPMGVYVQLLIINPGKKKKKKKEIESTKLSKLKLNKICAIR